MSGKRSIGGDKTPPRRVPTTRQMVDIRGNPLTTEQGSELITEREAYPLSEYGSDYSPSVVIDSDDYRRNASSTGNVFSKGSPAALPVIEEFQEQSEVSRSLLGVTRETTQRGLFGNVSTYGLDSKDWKVELIADETAVTSPEWWLNRPSASGNYYFAKFSEDDRNSSLVLSAGPTPFLIPPRPRLQDLLVGNTNPSRYIVWGQYINSIVSLYLFKYMTKNFTRAQWKEFNLEYLLAKYPPIENGDGTFSFNEILWDQIWLDIQQNRFGDISNYPIIPSGKAYNFNSATIENWRNDALWGSSGVVVTESSPDLPAVLDVSWSSFFFSTARVFFPSDPQDNKGHFKIKTNPSPNLWLDSFGLRWDLIRTDLKSWEFTVHKDESTVTQLEKDLKLPYFVLDTPLAANPQNLFSTLWPSDSFGAQINLPTITNRIGGRQGTNSEVILKSNRAFRYQPGRISGFTYGVSLSEIGAGPGTTLEFGIENATDAYMFRLTNGANFSIVRKSTVQLDSTPFLQDSGYAENTTTIIRNGRLQYETVIQQKDMNGDPLSGEGKTGYILNPDTVTMYKIEFGWYGAIGARFYAYVPVANNECRWVTLHTLVIENQLGEPCLADPFFYFKYRLKVDDSSTVRVDQTVTKFGASCYIDGYDEGTLYSLNAQSGSRPTPNPAFSESKTRLNSIDWVNLIGIKPKQSLTSRFGVSIFNKKEIFPRKAFVFSQVDSELKIIRQRGCPEFAYNHQEGYKWQLLPESRRLKAKFNIVPYFQLDLPALEISESDPKTHTAVASYNAASEGSFRDPRVFSNWTVIGNQAPRVVGDKLFALYPSLQDFSGGSLAVNFKRGIGYLSSRNPLPDDNNIYLPFLYSAVDQYVNGYDVEFDYFRRDQTLLSSVDVFSSEFYIYWTGLNPISDLSPTHRSSLRFGFVWPDTTDPSSDIYATESSVDWGIESNAEYDGAKFYEGLPYDFPNDYPDNTIYFETRVDVNVNSFNIEDTEYEYIWSPYYYLYPVENLGVPGSEGGRCSGLICRTTRREIAGVSVVLDRGEYFVSSTDTPFPNQSPSSVTVTLTQGSNVANVTSTGGTQRVIDNVVIYLLPLGSELPAGISLGPVVLTYNDVLIATTDKLSALKSVLVSKIAPGNLPFLRVFVQGRQGARIGGIWVGQKTSEGVRVDPLTPHRSTVSITDSGPADYHSQWSSSPQSDGAVKSITPITQNDFSGLSTAPTFDASESSLNTYKSVHTNPRKCGSFLSSGAAGISTGNDYPLRWFSSPTKEPSLGSFYISANTPTEIDLSSIFNVTGESILNDDDFNLATFFVARSISNHNNTNNEIYISLNYTEQ